MGWKVTLTVQLAPTARVDGEMGQVFVWAKSPGSVPAILTLLRVTADVPLLVTVTLIGELVTPTTTLPKLTLVGERVTADPAVAPVPETGSVCGLPGALSATDTEALLDPEAAGLKVTLIVQFFPAATLVPQVFVWVKSPEFVPVMVTLVMLRVAVPVLVRVVVRGVLLVPTV